MKLITVKNDYILRVKHVRSNPTGTHRFLGPNGSKIGNLYFYLNAANMMCLFPKKIHREDSFLFSLRHETSIDNSYVWQFGKKIYLATNLAQTHYEWFKLFSRA